jgi:tetraprenyl-beta-curcumene synthase
VALQSNGTRQLAGAFAAAACRYWLTVLPVARAELRRLRRDASRIPDRALRRLAMGVYQRDWASLEGVAAFAAFIPSTRRAQVVRLLVRFQSVYQYTDMLMERASHSHSANARRLHAAVLAAVDPQREHRDYYAYAERREDGGYLAELVDGCRRLLAGLPSYPLVLDAVAGHARRIVFYQSRVNLAGREDYPALARWARTAAPADAPQRWWEVAAASGSSLTALALLAAAATPDLDAGRVQVVEALYWPWMGALHTLLDSLVDRAEDAATGQNNLLDHYPSPVEMADRMEYLALESVRRADALGTDHRLILAGVVSLYLSEPQAWAPRARATTERVLAALGGLAAPAMMVLSARRLAHRPPRQPTPFGSGPTRASAAVRRARPATVHVDHADCQR